MFIGKTANPRCFKNVNKAALPVTYYSHKNIGYTVKLVYHHFVLAVAKRIKDSHLPVKALLLFDNAPSHPDATSLVESDIKISFLLTKLCLFNQWTKGS